jgi:FG-GAP-like repeat
MVVSPPTPSRPRGRAGERRHTRARLLGALAACALGSALAAGPADAADRCAASKLGAAAKSASCLLGLESREARSGKAPDPTRSERCRTKLARGFSRAESRRPCLTSGDAPATQMRVDAFVAGLDDALSVGTPNSCQASKLRASAKAVRRLLRLHAKAARKGAPADPSRVQASRDKLGAAFAKAERKPVCSTSGDAPAIADAIAAFVAEVDALLAGPGSGASLDSWTYKEVSASHEQTFGLAFGDLDGDGLADIVSGPYWYKNPGGDLLGSWIQSPPFPGGVHAMLTVDVDGDARSDVIAQAQSGTELYWLEATDATASAWTSTPIGNLPASPHAIGMQGFRVAQIEAGGKPELVFSSGGGVYAFRIPTASPEAGSWPSVRVSANPSDEGVAVGDMDGDGDLDLAAGTADGQRVEWYRNPGDGTADWTAFPLGDVSDFGFPDRFAAADMNGDDKLDVIGTEENGVSSGARTVWWEQPADPTSPGWVRHPVATQGTTNSLDVADLDGDGDPDVVTGEHRGSLRVTIFENDGDGAQFTAHRVDEGKESHLGAQLFDLDGDGDLDIVSIAYDAPEFVHLWRNDAAPTVPFEHVLLDEGLQGYLDCKAVGDLDGDDLPDVVIGTDTQLVWYRAPAWTRTLIAPGANFTTDMQVADVDGDGDLDIVVPEYDLARLEWYRNPRIGGGTWTAVPIGDGVTAHDVEVADMNGDDKPDVVIRGHYGPTTLYLQSSPVSWTPVAIQAAIDNEGTTLADLNGDGRVDIVQNGYWLEAPVDRSDGSAWIRHSFDASWEADTVAPAVADLSGDGRPDVILAFGERPGPLAWYEAPADPRIGADWIQHPIADGVDYVHTFETADVDGDGRLDVVFAEMAQSSQKRVGFFRNLGGGLGWTLQVLSTEGSHNIRVADIGADGDLDVVGANWQGPPVELWENRTVP